MSRANDCVDHQHNIRQPAKFGWRLMALNTHNEMVCI